MYHLRLAAIDAGIVRSFTSGLPQFERVRARLLGSRCSSSVETNRKRIYSSVMTGNVGVIACLYALRFCVRVAALR